MAMIAMQSEQARERLKRMSWAFLGLVSLFILLSLLAVAESPETRDYRAYQNALFGLVILAALLFLVRLRWLGTPSLHEAVRNRDSRHAYLSSGAWTADLLFLVAVTVFLFVLDLSFWPTFTIRLGVVLSVVLIRLLLSLILRRQ